MNPPGATRQPNSAGTTAARKALNVTLVALQYEYGDPNRGLSYEYQNLYLCLKEIFPGAKLFDFYTPFVEKGKEAMNRELLEMVKRERPDLTIFALYTDQFIPEIVEEMKTYTTTLCYFFDDDWRVEFAEAWAPRFHYFTSPRTHTLRRHRDRGFTNVIYSPFGYNHFVYQKRGGASKSYDVSFVGGFHPYRKWLIESLRKAGIKVAVWGHGWPEGKIDQDRMIDVFNQSKVNLNLSNSVSWDARYLLSSRKAVRNTLQSSKTTEQIKGRHFEICGCGGFQLSYYTEDLERHFEINREIVIYMDRDDLIEKVRYYLKHDEEREAIAEAGYRRAASQHTYARRLLDLADQTSGPR
jgi:spore maturation protein CgeB